MKINEFESNKTLKTPVFKGYPTVRLVQYNYSDDTAVVQKLEILIATERLNDIYELLSTHVAGTEECQRLLGAARRMRLRRVISVMLEYYQDLVFSDTSLKNINDAIMIINDNLHMLSHASRDDAGISLGGESSGVIAEAVISLADYGYEGIACTVFLQYQANFNKNDLLLLVERILERHRGPCAPRVKRKEWMHLLHAICESLKGYPELQKLVNSFTAIWAESAIEAGFLADAERSLASMTDLSDWRVHFLLGKTQAKLQKFWSAIESLDESILIRLQESPNATASGKNITLGFDEKNPEAALKAVINELEKFGYNAFLTAGTLLGYCREGNFLAHDKDIDIGIMATNDSRSVVEALVRSGQFMVRHEYVGLSVINMIPITHLGTGISIDVFVFHEDAEGYLQGIESDFGFTHYLHFEPFQIVKASFRDCEVHIPKSPERFLEQNFGCDWRAPIPAYLPLLESPAVRFKGKEVHKLLFRLELMRAIHEGNISKIMRAVHFADASWSADDHAVARVCSSVAHKIPEAGLTYHDKHKVQ